MRIRGVPLCAAMTLLAAACAPPDPAEQVMDLVESARATAGEDHQFVFGELCESSDAEYATATRDIVATDGYEIRLGDHVITTYLTPGHTHGTVSTVIRDVHDDGEPHRHRRRAGRQADRAVHDLGRALSVLERGEAMRGTRPPAAAVLLGLRAESMAADVPPVPPGAWIREDLDVPVFDLVTGGDMVTLGAHRTRQPAGATYRRWELAGAAHAEEPRWVVEPGDELPMGPGCAQPINTAPHDAFVKAGLRGLTEWVRGGAPPRQSADIEIGDADASDPIRRDRDGNALGGVRLPRVEAPTATIDGLQNSVPSGGPGALNFCFLFGHTLPFDRETLGELYPDHASFVERYVTAVDALEADGYLLAPEAEQARAAARASGIGR